MAPKAFNDDDHTLSEGRGPLLRQGSIEMAYEMVAANSANLASPWRAIDVVTKNTIYALDARLRCSALFERASGAQQEGHLFEGALLVGGAKRADDGRLLAVAHPLPEAGMSAVFEGERAGKRWHNETSEVIRIIIRQRVVTFEGAREREPSWDDLTGKRRRHVTLSGTPDF
ncbi:MAG: hypothetical protein DRJ42_30860 [Deltaproteobacteria bacterium]|nr:MAG: hypothetical protein DRJ42_30860 [Deltaproteobacteria bacterium]